MHEKRTTLEQAQHSLSLSLPPSSYKPRRL